MASVAEIIHQRHDDIVALWLDEARAAASARGLNKTALENIMPRYLSSLADQIDTGQLDANDRRHEFVHNHLATRLRQGFDLAEIVREFILLGRCISKMWQTLPEEQWPSAADIERLHLQIHVAITDVTDTFYRHMLEDEQADKRTGRLLQAIASEALRDDEAPLLDRLREVLEVVMEAMNAQCAAFLLFDVREGKLALKSCTGCEALEPYTTSLDPKAFVAEVAAQEEPLAVYDVDATKKEVPEALRGSGIKSLLGIRVPPRYDLLGVLYVGLTEARKFTEREIGRITLIGERISLHLENARLFAKLHEQVATLDDEKLLREQFVSTLAHDLRGPLSSARMAAELLLADPDANGRRELAVKLDRNLDRVDRMIRDLLDANRIRAGEALPLRLDTCDLCAIASQVAEEARMLHGDRFVLECGNRVRGIWSRDELHRAVWNLVMNAVKYGAPKQPITITVSADDHARVSVHNSGAPIAPADQANIFNAYARSTHAGERTGWGLGLTLVRGTAEAHGGRVTVKSDAESGTTFTIELPFDARTPIDIDRGGATVH